MIPSFVPKSLFPGIPEPAEPHPEHPVAEYDEVGALVRDVMTHKVVTVEPSDSLYRAAALLVQHDIVGMPVIEGAHKVIGILTEKDIVRVLRERLGVEMPRGLFELVVETSEVAQAALLQRLRASLTELRVLVAMTTPAKTTAPEVPALDAAREMLQLGVHQLPVVEHEDLVGIVSRADVLGPYRRRS